MKDNDLEKIYENYLSVGMQQMDEEVPQAGTPAARQNALANTDVNPANKARVQDSTPVQRSLDAGATTKKGPSVQVAQAGADKMLINLANMVEADPQTWNTQLTVLKQTHTAFSDLSAEAFVILMRKLAEQLGTSAVTGRVRDKYDAAAVAATPGDVK